MCGFTLIAVRAAGQIVAPRAEGTVADAEYAAFQTIIAKAKAGDWSDAERRVFELCEAQNPSAEDLWALERRELSGRDAKPALATRRMRTPHIDVRRKQN